MRRKIYFFLDRLQISRNERMVLALCGACLILLTVMNLVTEQRPEFDPELYRELELRFEERNQENRAILARYSGRLNEGIPEIPADTISELPDGDVDVSTDTPPAAEDSGGRLTVDINRAGLEELQELPGIGPVYAGRILEWREQHGNFMELEQLMEIRGIGERRLEILLPHIRITEEKE